MLVCATSPRRGIRLGDGVLPCGAPMDVRGRPGLGAGALMRLALTRGAVAALTMFVFSVLAHQQRSIALGLTTHAGAT